MAEENFDAIVVGSGFGGAVTACRLTQAGLKVCLLERGRRYDLSSFPALPKEGQTLPDMRRWTWQGSQGLWDLRNLEGITVAQSAGYGGGSLIYANVHLRPPAELFDTAWPADCKGRKELDRYYDLVGSMLDIKPVPAQWRNVGKVGVMAAAFRDAAGGRARGEPPLKPPYPDDGNVFFPPLAIQFPKEPVESEAEPALPPFPREFDLELNAYDRPQGSCVRCGACDVGCRYGAKNTLDRNYLAVAEDTHNLTVRTLAEVVTVSTDDRRPDGEYRVVYMDHLIRSRESVSARYVFLCGGAVNTTELLLRSTEQRRSTQRADFDPALGNGLADVTGVGTGYFVNADAVAMIFDADKKTYASAGPVITTALVYQREKKVIRRGALTETFDFPEKCAPARDQVTGRSWFLIEDGGYPQSVAHVFSIFENTGLLGRNRFDPDSLARALSRVAPARGPSPRPERYPAFLDGFLAAVRENTLPNMLPRAVLTAKESLATIVDHLRDGEAGDLVEELRDAVLENSGPFRLLKRAKIDEYWPWLWQALYDLSIYVMRIRRHELLATTLGRTRYRYGADEPRKLSDRLSHAVLGEPYPVNPSKSPFKKVETRMARDRQSAMLLAMGRDDMPATLTLDDRHQLRADFPNRGFPTLGEEERVMRGIADQFAGTLRSNPMWALARRPITAHSHGGCALGRVTDDWGEVIDHRNLFINDGSLIPKPVGVNPSSTIAAIAERNVEHFVRHKWYVAQGKSPDDELPAEWKGHIERAKLWKARQDGVALEPPHPAAVLLHHESVGFSFDESMQGHLLRTDSAEPSRLPEAGKSRIPLAPFLVAEHRAREQKTTASFRLTAAVHDIAAFLDDPHHQISLNGVLRLDAGAGLHPAGKPVEIPIENGTLNLLIESDAGGRLMVYHLPFTNNGDAWTLVGYKEIQKDPGFDAWLDASTLYVELVRETIRFKKAANPDVVSIASAVHARGILRLGLLDFLNDQVQGLRALGTTDPARTIWTLGSFGLFFFGTMQGAYAPEIDRVLELFGGGRLRAEPVPSVKGTPRTLDFLTGL